MNELSPENAVKILSLSKQMIPDDACGQDVLKVRKSLRLKIFEFAEIFGLSYRAIHRYQIEDNLNKKTITILRGGLIEYLIQNFFELQTFINESFSVETGIEVAS